ncbi:MAG: hypothetical protein HRT67_01905 [Flavobacteriaceae bacterium]|nr:hypothetical protein [Flavobacteriaceae bacterium]
MIRTVILTLFVLATNIATAQNFDFKLIDKLTKISFVSIDELMIDGYGFRKFKNSNGEKESNTRTYARYYNNEFKNTIVIKVLSPKDKPNVIDINITDSFDVRSIKDKLLSMGYTYNGSNGYGYTVYKKEKSTYIIAKKPTDKGITHIMVFTEW